MFDLLTTSTSERRKMLTYSRVKDMVLVVLHELLPTRSYNMVLRMSSLLSVRTAIAEF